jgi:hypothetical protein
VVLKLEMTVNKLVPVTIESCEVAWSAVGCVCTLFAISLTSVLDPDRPEDRGEEAARAGVILKTIIHTR